MALLAVGEAQLFPVDGPFVEFTGDVLGRSKAGSGEASRFGPSLWRHLHRVDEVLGELAGRSKKGRGSDEYGPWHWQLGIDCPSLLLLSPLLFLILTSRSCFL